MLHLGSLHGEIEKLAIKLSERQKAASRTLDELCNLLSEPGELRDIWYKLPEDDRKNAAVPIEEPGLKYALPKRPPELTLCASDGSQILPDRNLNIDFFLINISRICFQIGTVEPPTLDARSRLYTTDDYQALGLTNENEEPVSTSPEIVAAIRQEQELHELFKLAYTERHPGRPVLAIADGTLIFWHLKKLGDKKESFAVSYRNIFEKFRLEGLPVASYLSFPGGKDVMHSLRPLLSGQMDDTAAFVWLYDRDLFYRYLKPGERSALFETSSDAMTDCKYHEEDKIFFFYLHTGWEIARVEFPKWCAGTDRKLIDFMHSAICDDLQKGGGYPMTLTEAHEHAVVKPREHEQILHLLERVCVREGFPMTHSAKSHSKRSAQI